MKKVCIITFHSAENAGAALQCYALQCALNRMGIDVKIINYQPDYLKKQYSIFINPFNNLKKTNLLKSFLAYSLQNIKFYKKLKRKIKFIKFRNKFLNMTMEYKSLDELLIDPPIADVYVSGSDQLWNNLLTGGSYDPAFFLKFGPEQTKKIAYAISTGKELLDKDYEIIYKMSADFDAVSFREKSVCEQFNTKFPFMKAKQCVDPTFLLDIDEWKNLIKANIAYKDYILIYGLEKNNAFQKVVDYVKKTYSTIKIVDISQCNLYLKGKVIKVNEFSPDEFLSFIYNAKYIVTNSFHCSVFSIIFEKQFLTIPHSRSNNRLFNLLDAFNMTNHLLEKNEENIEVIYDIVSTKDSLDYYRTESIKYLMKNVVSE